MLEISLIKDADYQHRTTSAYVRLCLSLCASENQPLGSVSSSPEKSEKVALFLRLELACTAIRHESIALETPAFCLARLACYGNGYVNNLPYLPLVFHQMTR